MLFDTGKKKNPKKTFYFHCFCVNCFFCLLAHGPHRAGDRVHVVTAEIDLCQGGDVTNGQRELTKVVIGEVEAAETREPGEEENRDGEGKFKSFLICCKD